MIDRAKGRNKTWLQYRKKSLQIQQIMRHDKKKILLTRSGRQNLQQIITIWVSYPASRKFDSRVVDGPMSWQGLYYGSQAVVDEMENHHNLRTRFASLNRS